MVEEHIDPSMIVQTEFEEWVENGLNRAEEIINKAEKDT